MDFSDFKTGKDDEGRRLDKVVRIFISDTALSAIYKSLRKGLIKVNGNKAAPDYRIQKDDVITIANLLLKDSCQKQSEAVEQADKIIEKLRVFENEHLLILNKPTGMKVQGSRKDDISLQRIVEAYYKANFSNDSHIVSRPSSVSLKCLTPSASGLK